MERDKIIDEGEASELLGLKASTLRVWRSKKRGPPGFRVGRAVRYRRSEVLNWLNERRFDFSEGADAF